MAPVVHRVVLGVALSCVLASPGDASSVPSVANSTIPTNVVLVGSAGGAPDAAIGQFTILLRDLANNPLTNASVVLDFSNSEDLVICADQLDPAALVNCAAKTIGKFTDIQGSVTFTLLGGSNGAGNATTLQNGARIYGNGVIVGSPAVAAYDLDGASGVGANDLSAWLSDFGTGIAYGRSDYDVSGEVGANDLAIWFSAFATGASATSCATSCP